VVTSGPPIAGAECFRDLPSALAALGAATPVWFIGGARIYEEAMRHADVIDVTYVPDHVEAEGAVRFPPIDPAAWEPGPLLPHEDEPALTRRVYTRRPDAPSRA
jgi:dihydrofolate reductase